MCLPELSGLFYWAICLPLYIINTPYSLIPIYGALTSEGAAPLFGFLNAPECSSPCCFQMNFQMGLSSLMKEPPEICTPVLLRLGSNLDKAANAMLSNASISDHVCAAVCSYPTDRNKIM